MILDEAITRHLAWLRAEKGVSPHTIAAYTTDYARFAAFAAEEFSIDELARVTRELVISFQQHEAERGIGARTQSRRLSSLRGLFRHAQEEKWVVDNPLADIRQPRQPRRLPHILSAEDVEKLLDVALRTPTPLRDLALLEVLYGGGLRVSEATSLTLDRLMLEDKALRVIGKGERERIVPLGRPACIALRRYMEAERPRLLTKGRTDTVFLSPRGRGLTRQAVFALIRRLAERAGLDQAPSPHDLRHAFATHLVEHGADLRAVQTLLGHANISTTEVYTHVSRSHLSRMHHEHHPRERATRSRKAEEARK
ncbi:MAG: tyrosine recombinase [Deltaproteobacteria bacterium]